jgi:hypothetical protein
MATLPEIFLHQKFVPGTRDSAQGLRLRPNHVPSGSTAQKAPIIFSVAQYCHIWPVWRISVSGRISIFSGEIFCGKFCCQKRPRASEPHSGAGSGLLRRMPQLASPRMLRGRRPRASKVPEFSGERNGTPDSPEILRRNSLAPKIGESSSLRRTDSTGRRVVAAGSNHVLRGGALQPEQFFPEIFWNFYFSGEIMILRRIMILLENLERGESTTQTAS